VEDSTVVDGLDFVSEAKRKAYDVAQDLVAYALE
jgi:hypothetical protein